MTKLQIFCVLCCLLITSFTRGAEPAPDPFLGSWVLDPQASHYPNNSCPKLMTIEMSLETRGVHYHSHTQPRAGDAFDVDYIANYNGKPVMVTGNKGILLPVSVEWKGATVVATYRNAFQVVATSQRVLSADRNTMTITTVSHDEIGVVVTNIGVYKRVPSSSPTTAITMGNAGPPA